MDPKPKGSTACEDFDAFTREMEHNWQLIRRGTWHNEKLSRRRGMMTREMRRSCQIMRIWGFKMETMRMRWRQERLWCGDADTTIWGVGG